VTPLRVDQVRALEQKLAERDAEIARLRAWILAVACNSFGLRALLEADGAGKGGSEEGGPS